jgi:hypothetical protein
MRSMCGRYVTPDEAAMERAYNYPAVFLTITALCEAFPGQAP